MDINLTGMTWIHILCQNPLTDSGSKLAHLNLIGWFKITVAVNPAKRCHRLSREVNFFLPQKSKLLENARK